MSTTSILQLPDDILEKIVSNVEICHFNQIRNVSKRFRNVVGNYVIHKYQVACLKYNKIDAFSYQTAVLNILKFCTEQFWHLDGEIYQHFAGVLLPMLTNFTKYAFPPQLSDIGAFMKIFFEIFSKYKQHSHFSASYLQTLLRVLKKFKASEWHVEHTPANSMLLVQVRFSGFYLKQIWKEIKRTPRQRADPFNLLAILAELLCADIRNADYRHVFECKDCLYQYGRQLSMNKIQTTLIFEIYIKSTSVMLGYLQEYLKFLQSDEYVQLNWQQVPPNEQLGFLINCKSNNYRAFFVRKQSIPFSFNDEMSSHIKIAY